MHKRSLALAIAATLIFSVPTASAHQPVNLLPTDTTAQKGPLLKDGTISFAIRAIFTKAGEKRGFRAALTSGDNLAVQYLIVDKKPENTLKNSQFPLLVITSPTGKKTTITFNERTKFYEPFGKTNYLYLSRFTAPVEEGIYFFNITSRGKAAITIAVGEKEITGEVIRGEVAPQAASQSPTPSASPIPTTSSSKASASPTPEKSTAKGYTMDDVRQHNSSAKCWSAINGNVYDLTQWINSHPGGSAAIKSLCGTDGTKAFNNQHSGQGSPERNLDSFLLGPLSK